MTKPKKVKVVKRHSHRFRMERALLKEGGLVEALDLRCDCGMPLWCPNPETHVSDGPNRPLKESELTP